MSRDPELRVIARAQRGHTDAFRELVEAYKDRLHAFVWRTLRDHHEAEDIVQAAFVKAYESLSSYSSQYAFSTWLFTIAYRLCLNHLRRKRPACGDIELSNVGRPEDDVATTLAGSEDARRLRERIWAAVDELSPPQRSAVLLFYREGKGCQEIGRILDVPTVTVKSHLHRAREKLRKMLSAELVDDWMAVQYLNESRLH
jgi:RNA polymerase sigma-70 factor (ECF subfamily)